MALPVIDARERSGAMTPYVSALRRGVDEALRGLIAPTPAELRWEARAPAREGRRGEIVVEVRLAGGDEVGLVIGEDSPGAPSFASGRGLALSYRPPRGGPEGRPAPVVRAFLDNLGRRLRSPRSAAAWEALHRALQTVLPFAGIRDFMYRTEVEPGTTLEHATLRLGFRCNQDCSFCWQGRSWPEPPPELYETWLDELAARGVRDLTLSGGEPTLHPSLPALVRRAASEHGMVVRLETNAIRLRKEPYLDTLIEAGLREAFVSYHSADPEISDRMTRAPNTHRRTVEGIEACLRRGVEVVINCVVERANVGVLREHAGDVVQRFCAPFPDNPVRRVVYSHPCEYYDPADHAAAAVPFDEVRPSLVAAIDRLAEAGVTVDCTGTCGFPPCVIYPRPEHIRWLEPGAVPESEAAGHRYDEACDRCSRRGSCLGVREEYVQVFGFRGVVPF